jgi:hypothetical protein
MGLFDFLRGFVPSAAPQFLRNPWAASADPTPFWLLDPAAYDGSDASGPMPLPDRLGGPDSPGPMPLPDWPLPSFDDIHAQLLAGAASRIGPEHFALNPDNWTQPIANPSTVGPYSVPGSGSGLPFETPLASQLTSPTTFSNGDVASVPRIGDAAIAQNSPASIDGRSADPAGQATANTRDEKSGDENSGDAESWSAAHAALNIGSFIPGPIGSLAALGDAGYRSRRAIGSAPALEELAPSPE